MTNNRINSTNFWGRFNGKAVATVEEITKDRVKGTISQNSGMSIPFETAHNAEYFHVGGCWFYFKNWTL